MPIVPKAGGGLLSRKVEIAANLATLIVAVILAVVLVKNNLLPMKPPRTEAPAVRSTEAPATVRTDLSKRLPGVDWRHNGRTLVLALSTRCHFCTASAPFFKKISQRAGKNLTLVGVFPQKNAEAESYLSREGIRVAAVKQVSLDRIGVRGTPTLLLADSKGVVIETWIGKLAPEKEEQALKAIFAVRSPAASTQETVAF